MIITEINVKAKYKKHMYILSIIFRQIFMEVSSNILPTPTHSSLRLFLDGTHF